MINRLLDDFEDEALRTYWDKNLKFLSTQNVSEPVGITNTFFSPAYRLNLMAHDFYKDSKNHCLKNSIEFSEKSSQDIFDIYNNIISFQTNNQVISFGTETSWWKERSKLFNPSEVTRIVEKVNKARYGSTITFSDLKIQCKDLLFLATLIQNYELKINNDNLISLCQTQLHEFMSKTSTLDKSI